MAAPRPGRPARALAAALAVLVLGACSSGDGQQDADDHGKRERASGKPTGLTVVDPKNVKGLKEETSTEKGKVDVKVSYPKIPNAEPFTQRLEEITNQEVEDFTGANPKAKSITIDWDLSVAGDDIVAVRLTRTEQDDKGERTGYATYWYDAKRAHTAYSTELLAGQKELDTLDSLVRAELKKQKEVDTSAVHPIVRLYDSMGFNPDGDLVVEFDQGEVASPKAGRVHAVIPESKVAPLLSDLGKRAHATATVVTHDFTIAKQGAAPKDDPGTGPVPGMFPVGDGEVDCSAKKSKCVALTFDDGPGKRTPELLDMLAEHKAKATFFLTGVPVREFPDTVRREYAEGHELAGHTVHHQDLTTLSRGEVRDELDTVADLVRRQTGYSLDLMRPPYGATNDMVADVTRDAGQAQILWSVDTNDWRNRDPDVVAKRAVSGAKPGAIILMHDIHGSTIDAVPKILDQLSKKGYTMVTVSQLLGETEPGASYREAKPKPDKKDEKGKDDKNEDRDGGKDKDGKDADRTADKEERDKDGNRGD